MMAVHLRIFLMLALLNVVQQTYGGGGRNPRGRQPVAPPSPPSPQSSSGGEESPERSPSPRHSPSPRRSPSHSESPSGENEGPVCDPELMTSKNPEMDPHAACTEGCINISQQISELAEQSPGSKPMAILHSQCGAFEGGTCSFLFRGKWPTCTCHSAENTRIYLTLCESSIPTMNAVSNAGSYMTGFVKNQGQRIGQRVNEEYRKRIGGGGGSGSRSVSRSPSAPSASAGSGSGRKWKWPKQLPRLPFFGKKRAPKASEEDYDE